MAKGISLYPTKNTGGEAPVGDVTGTPVAGDKVALDVAIKEGSVDVGEISGSVKTEGLSQAAIVMLDVPDNAWVAANPALTDRANIAVQNRLSNPSIVLMSFDNTFPGSDGWEIYPGGNISRTLDEGVTMYLRSVTGTNRVAVEGIGD